MIPPNTIIIISNEWDIHSQSILITILKHFESNINFLGLLLKIGNTRSRKVLYASNGTWLDS